MLRYDQKKGGSKMVGSITMLGYFIMALLYWWPFGGWRRSFKGLRKLYREDPVAAVEKYRLSNSKRNGMASNMNL